MASVRRCTLLLGRSLGRYFVGQRSLSTRVNTAKARFRPHHAGMLLATSLVVYAGSKSSDGHLFKPKKVSTCQRETVLKIKLRLK